MTAEKYFFGQYAPIQFLPGLGDYMLPSTNDVVKVVIGIF